MMRRLAALRPARRAAPAALRTATRPAYTAATAGDANARAGDAQVAALVDASERRLMSLYSDFGHNEYIGEPFTIMEHSVQTAAAARASGESEEVVLSCLLHDVGHLLGLEANAPPEMDGCGVEEHERVGAEFLGALGLSDTVSYLALHHVSAKRYRCATEPGYMERLSPASATTLRHQGGPMSPEECAKVERDPRWPLVIRMRGYDEQGKDPTLEEGDPLHYRGMVRENLAKSIRQQLASGTENQKHFPLAAHAATYVLSEEQMRVFEKDGFVHVPNALPAETATRLASLASEAERSLSAASSSEEELLAISPRQLQQGLAAGGAVHATRAENFSSHLSTWSELCTGLAQDLADQALRTPAALLADTLHRGGSALSGAGAAGQREISFMVAIDEQVISGLSASQYDLAFEGGEFVLDGEVQGTPLVCKPGDVVLAESSLLQAALAEHRLAHLCFAAA